MMPRNPRNKIINVINYGLTPSSDGPFSNTGSPFHGPTGYPAYNLAKAKQLVQQYEQAHGVTSVSVQRGATNTGAWEDTYGTKLFLALEKNGNSLGISALERDKFFVPAPDQPLGASPLPSASPSRAPPAMPGPLHVNNNGNDGPSRKLWHAGWRV